MLSAALALGVHFLAPELLPWNGVFALGGGLLLGLVLGSSHAWLPWGQHGRTNRVVAKDISTLRDAFAVLQQQVKATISSSESAVMAMMSRMTRVHGNAQTLHARIRHAVERSQALSSDSLSNAGQHGEAVAHLAEHQRSFEQARHHNLERVRAVADQVRQLSPLAALIADISRQTNLLAINASIEAARAGREGAGFKVVAAEVRRLSTQTTEAARQITEGIQAAAASIDGEMARADAMEGDAAATQLSTIAAQMQVMSQTLGEVVPYLGELSGNMESGMSEVTTDILDTLGDMQFQDINRQLLEQINQALASLSDHFAQLCELIDGDAPPPPVLLEELLARWNDHYVMHSQRVAHQQGLAGRSEPAANDAQVPDEPPAQATGGNGPRIEFF